MMIKQRDHCLARDRRVLEQNALDECFCPASDSTHTFPPVVGRCLTTQQTEQRRHGRRRVHASADGATQLW